MFRYTRPVLCMLIAITIGCGSSTPSVQTRSIKGHVKLDGKPMPEGEILFVIPRQVPQMFLIKDGAYSGSANEGKARVEIRTYKDAAPVMMDGKVANPGAKDNTLPDKYNTNSTLTSDVTASGPNEFNFEVTSE